MFTGRFLIAVIVITTAITLIQWLFTGFLFHKYQALTPATWRKESRRSYAASAMLSLFFSFMFATTFSIWKNSCDCSMVAGEGIVFGIFFWLAFSVPAEINNAVYVNYSNMFTLGKCISSLAEYVVAGMVAAAML